MTRLPVLQNLYSKLLFKAPDAPPSPLPQCQSYNRVVFSRKIYTSIHHLFLTVFYYCQRKEGSHAQLALLSTDNFKAIFRAFPPRICLLPILSGTNEKSWYYTSFAGFTSPKRTNKVISTILEFSALTVTQGASVCLRATQGSFPGFYPSFRGGCSN